MTEQPGRDPTQEHHGWPNYPTWAAFIWLSSDERIAIDACDRAELRLPQERPDSIRSWIEEENPLADSPSLYSDLLTWSLRHIDSDKVTDGLRDETPETARDVTQGVVGLADDPLIVSGHEPSFQERLTSVAAGELHCPHCSANLAGQTFFIGGLPEVRLLCPKEECGYESLLPLDGGQDVP